MKLVVAVEIDAPEGTTHYSGDILDLPTWWKRSTNSTGVITAWYACVGVGKPWYFQSEHEPHWLYPTPTLDKPVKRGE